MSEVDNLEDGYRWRKYGQKAISNSPYPRSYYRCTTASCKVKKRVQPSVKDPGVLVTTYEGQHTHQGLQPFADNQGHNLGFSTPNGTNRSLFNERRSCSPAGGSTLMTDLSSPSKNARGSLGNADIDKCERRSPRFASADVGDGNGKTNSTFVQVERRSEEEETKRAEMSEVDHLEDGYRWRKYGQKAIRNSPYPRSYFRCTSASCNAKKRVEQSVKDPGNIVTTYEGQHNHVSPLMMPPLPSITALNSIVMPVSRPA